MNVPRYPPISVGRPSAFPRGEEIWLSVLFLDQKNDNLSLSERISSIFTDGMAEYLPPAMLPL